ncbi:MAG: formate dehydrogenase subunit delta [Proteobacteria bacterium]|nr:formate dehydrogenase subunit delta [Pseudomonadota bacterium]
METGDMVRMANQIGDYFKGYGEAEAVKEISNHMNAYWEPRMRRSFFALLDQGGEGLSDIVKKAASKVRRPAEAA